MKSIIEEINFESLEDSTKHNFIATKNPNGLYRITEKQKDENIWQQRYFYNNKELHSYDEIIFYIKYQFRLQKINKILCH